jgi:hypothetical protein
MKLSRKLLPFLLIVVSLSAWTCTIGSSPPPPNTHTYSYSFLGTFNDPGFPNISIQLTPLIPPKLLSKLPSDYLQVDVTVGTLHFSTSNPVYKCLEAVVPLIFTEEIAYPGLFIAVYNNCGKIILPSSASEAMVGHLSLATQQYAMFTFPRNSSLCSTSSSGQSQCILPVNPTPTPVNPTPTPVSPTPTPISPTPTSFMVNNITVSVNPASLAKEPCDFRDTFTYTAVVSVDPGSPGGTVNLTFSGTDGSNQISSINFNEGDTSQKVDFSVTGLVGEQGFPPNVTVTSTSPNAFHSSSVGPTDKCIPVG